jgi:hypothetical protein
MKPEELLIQ